MRYFNLSDKQRFVIGRSRLFSDHLAFAAARQSFTISTNVLRSLTVLTRRSLYRQSCTTSSCANLAYWLSSSRALQHKRLSTSAAVSVMATANSPLYSGLPPLPEVAAAEPARIALDAFRLAIADQVAKSLKLDVAKLYDAVLINTKGCDANLAMARFKTKEEDAKSMAERVVKEVGTKPPVRFQPAHRDPLSSRRTTLSPARRPMAHSLISTSILPP